MLVRGTESCIYVQKRFFLSKAANERDIENMFRSKLSGYFDASILPVLPVVKPPWFRFSIQNLYVLKVDLGSYIRFIEDKSDRALAIKVHHYGGFNALSFQQHIRFS